jgi:hypothetical protein
MRQGTTAVFSDINKIPGFTHITVTRLRAAKILLVIPIEAIFVGVRCKSSSSSRLAISVQLIKAGVTVSACATTSGNEDISSMYTPGISSAMVEFYGFKFRYTSTRLYFIISHLPQAYSSVVDFRDTFTIVHTKALQYL